MIMTQSRDVLIDRWLFWRTRVCQSSWGLASFAINTAFTSSSPTRADSSG